MSIINLRAAKKRRLIKEVFRELGQAKDEYGNVAASFMVKTRRSGPKEGKQPR
ncbi:MAG: hypothetical protein KGI00_01415 [Candidatus Micrarchaeota archaeon]|nr:hypothetical protein [Candidatus Micrarchaeota archaeon]MDE1824227.1 hypothetical protein [Candidatus Micrarchaeota archaeon]MDE1849368.1 hypothetical protein [Candidatus Micrarchaeota archaeon]